MIKPIIVFILIASVVWFVAYFVMSCIFGDPPPLWAMFLFGLMILEPIAQITAIIIGEEE